jgi:acyl-coenzyme A synthetase/AMP-(fatty) acid ligase
LNFKQDKVDEIVISGGETTKVLKDKLVRKFNSRITCLFGASETGYWSKNDVTNNDDYSNLGCADIGTEIQVEDMCDDGVGILKIKNQHSVDGYLGGEITTNFKSGWFYPGDKAFQKESQMYLLGRDDTVVNVGGIKISPQQIDDFLVNQDGVKDAACFWIKDKFGYNELWSAVVIEEISSLENLMAKVKAKFGIDGGPKRVIPVEFIPRTYSGKPQRNLMSEKITQQVNLLKFTS